MLFFAFDLVYEEVEEQELPSEDGRKELFDFCWIYAI